MLYLAVFAVLSVLAAGTVVLKKLSNKAATAGVFIGLAIFAGAGFTGLFMLAGFFIAGTWATGHKKGFKSEIGFEEKDSGRREVSQVFANAGVAALCGIFAFLIPEKSETFNLMLAASFSSATADTLSSELGNAYGKRFYNIVSLKPDRRGLDGVISLEGTLFGIAGALFIAIMSFPNFQRLKYVLIVAISGIFGNIIDSVFGATLQRKGWLTNDGVNFLNTLVSALFSLYLAYL